MRRQWLWLEDQAETVADFRLQADSIIGITNFERSNDLVVDLVDRLSSNRIDNEPFGLILDVMLTGDTSVDIPRAWLGGEKTVYFPTQRGGWDAGLVFYEKLFLPHSHLKLLHIPPPPVIFLTVVNKAFLDLKSRFDKIKEMWALENKCNPDQAKVEWVDKWHAQGTTLADLVAEWDR